MSLSNPHAPPPSEPNCSGVGSSENFDTLFGGALYNTAFADINILDQYMRVPQTLYDPSINTLSTSTPFDQSGISEWVRENTMQHGSVEENRFPGLPSMSYGNSTSNNYHPNPPQIPTSAPLDEKDDNAAMADGNVPSRRQHRPGTGTNPGRVKCRWEGCTYAGDFTRDTTLWRHIKTQHLFPNAFACPVRQCRRAFGRKDKYDEHMRDAHGMT
ncbi:hypothetical protein DTO027B5_8553 [Paecilomyces variotii]|nr:hypothetical protein DTO021C3_7485 [Paecilomyces variotii]KAJ9305600.1 hypothetical protein DTO217A2_4829 [Paecilomyces variotii]KAJ9323189.1 hypothetical protein DTO027B3_5760 [Paecilomyces variotii]KAJ9328910.1 hypothetical protein DTO027B5_8553 [Paecilomyces variotii]KAJ9361104.1 hypothetical protein DTO027B9_953 [Paecilomyces variotii]